jgi:hypothetical protein
MTLQVTEQERIVLALQLERALDFKNPKKKKF